MAAGAPGAEFGGGERPAELLGDLREAPTLKMVQREERAFVGREVGEERFDFIGRGAGSRIGSGIGCVGRVVSFRGTVIAEPAAADRLASKIIAAGVGRDAEEPMHERLLLPPLGEAADHAKKSFLHEIIEIGLGADEAPEQSAHRRVVAQNQSLHCRAVARLRPGGALCIGIGRRTIRRNIRGGW